MLDFSNSNAGKQLSTNLNSKPTLINRLSRGRHARQRFVESHISKALAFQIRSLREQESWTQETLAEKIGSTQNAVYRAENPRYGKQTITTLKRIAAAFDVGLAVRFVPFSELIDWVSGTPHLEYGLTTGSFMIPSFEAEASMGVFGPGRGISSNETKVPGAAVCMESHATATSNSTNATRAQTKAATKQPNAQAQVDSRVYRGLPTGAAEMCV